MPGAAIRRRSPGLAESLLHGSYSARDVERRSCRREAPPPFEPQASSPASAAARHGSPTRPEPLPGSQRDDLRVHSPCNDAD